MSAIGGSRSPGDVGAGVGGGEASVLAAAMPRSRAPSSVVAAPPVRSPNPDSRGVGRARVGSGVSTHSFEAGQGSAAPLPVAGSSSLELTTSGMPRGRAASDRAFSPSGSLSDALDANAGGIAAAPGMPPAGVGRRHFLGIDDALAPPLAPAPAPAAAPAPVPAAVVGAIVRTAVSGTLTSAAAAMLGVNPTPPPASRDNTMVGGGATAALGQANENLNWLRWRNLRWGGGRTQAPASVSVTATTPLPLRHMSDGVPVVDGGVAVRGAWNILSAVLWGSRQAQPQPVASGGYAPLPADEAGEGSGAHAENLGATAMPADLIGVGAEAAGGGKVDDTSAPALFTPVRGGPSKAGAANGTSGGTPLSPGAIRSQKVRNDREKCKVAVVYVGIVLMVIALVTAVIVLCKDEKCKSSNSGGAAPGNGTSTATSTATYTPSITSSITPSASASPKQLALYYPEKVVMNSGELDKFLLYPLKMVGFAQDAQFNVTVQVGRPEIAFGAGALVSSRPRPSRPYATHRAVPVRGRASDFNFTVGGDACVDGCSLNLSANGSSLINLFRTTGLMSLNLDPAIAAQLNASLWVVATQVAPGIPGVNQANVSSTLALMAASASATPTSVPPSPSPLMPLPLVVVANPSVDAGNVNGTETYPVAAAGAGVTGAANSPLYADVALTAARFDPAYQRAIMLRRTPLLRDVPRVMWGGAACDTPPCDIDLGLLPDMAAVNASIAALPFESYFPSPGNLTVAFQVNTTTPDGRSVFGNFTYKVGVPAGASPTPSPVPPTGSWVGFARQAVTVGQSQSVLGVDTKVTGQGAFPVGPVNGTLQCAIEGVCYFSGGDCEKTVHNCTVTGIASLEQLEYLMVNVYKIIPPVNPGSLMNVTVSGGDDKAGLFMLTITDALMPPPVALGLPSVVPVVRPEKTPLPVARSVSARETAVAANTSALSWWDYAKASLTSAFSACSRARPSGEVTAARVG